MRQIRVTVNRYEKALVFRNGEIVRVLDQGSYWVSPWRKLVKYDVTELFYHDIDLDLMLECEDLKARLDIIEVSDDQIAIQYAKGNFNRVLTPGQYAYWKAGPSYTYDWVRLDDIEVDAKISRSVLNQVAVRPYLTAHVIERYESGLLYIAGQLVKELDPGTYYYWKGQKYAIVTKIDRRRQQLEVSGQELLTADKAGIRVSLFADYQVDNIVKAVSESKGYDRQLYVGLQLALREYVGQYSLDQLLSNKAGMAPYILESMSAKAEQLGIKLWDVGIRDIILPGDVKDIMNQVLVAEKRAQANTIMRREETASTRSLLNTAKLMEDNTMLYQLKEMEYMEKIAEKVGEITLNGGGRVVDQLRDLVGNK